MSRGTKAVDRYVDAFREVEALRQAERDDSKPRPEAIRLALARRIEAERALNGGQLGQARRALAGQVAHA